MPQPHPDYDSLDFFTEPAINDDPYPYYHHIRAKCPVMHAAHNAVLVTSFDLGAEIYRDTEHYSSVNAVNGPLPPLPFTPHGDDITDQIEAHRAHLPMAGLLVTLDAPTHAPLRSFVLQLFSPERLAQNAPNMIAIADRLIDEFANAGEVELVRHFGVPFAGLVIADLLGVPHEDRAWFREMFSTRPRLDQAKDRDNYNPLAFLDDKFTEYMIDRRANPRDDVLSEIANATLFDGTKPTLEQVVTIATFLALESRLGVKAIIFGMLGGMAANTLIVTLAAARSGVALLGRPELPGAARAGGVPLRLAKGDGYRRAWRALHRIPVRVRLPAGCLRPVSADPGRLAGNEAARRRA
mgnify:CR=1 FL=1